MRSSSKDRKTSARESLLLERIKELEKKLAASIPKAEFDAVKSNLELEIDDLQRRLSDSVPRGELEAMRNETESRFMEIQQALSECKRETDILREKISELESRK